MRRPVLALPLVALLLLAPAAAVAQEAPSEAKVVTGKARTTPISVEGVSDDGLRKDLLAFGPLDGRDEFEWRLEPGTIDGKRKNIDPFFELSFPSPRPSGVAENDVVWCRWHPARGKNAAPGAQAPAAIILHHLAGAGEIETMVAEYLSRAGVAALEVDFPFYGRRRPAVSKGDLEKGLLRAELEQGVAASRQSVADVRRALDWLVAQPGIDARRVGLVGISLGAIQGSLVLGAEPRLTRNVLTLGGGDIPAILLHESRETRKVREVIAERGISREDLAARTAAIEPLRYARRIDAKGVIMLNASEDEIIPRECTDALWKAIGEPEIHWYPTHHASIGGFLLELMARMRAQFLRPVDPPPAKGEPEVF